MKRVAPKVPFSAKQGSELALAYVAAGDSKRALNAETFSCSSNADDSTQLSIVAAATQRRSLLASEGVGAGRKGSDMGRLVVKVADAANAKAVPHDARVPSAARLACATLCAATVFHRGT